MTYTHSLNSPLGTIVLGSDGAAICGLWFERQKYFGSGLLAESRDNKLPVFDECEEWLRIYFEGRDPGFTPPLQLEGSEFRRQVWEILLKIPYGETSTYGEIAREIAKTRGLNTMSAQAVGGAVGHNPVGIIVPCHRVLGSDRSLTGYAGGLEKKIALLKLEQIEYKE